MPLISLNLIFKKIPYNVERFYAKNVSQKLIELLQANTYDFIQVEGAFVANAHPTGNGY